MTDTAENGALPAGPFDVIVADPPWRYNNTRTDLRSNGRGAGAEHHYDTMTNADLAALPVADIAASDAHLFLWFTNPFTWGGMRSPLHPEDMARAWGFRFQTIITWVKTTADGEVSRGGTGWYFRGATEHVLYATRGKARIAPAIREPNVLLAPRSRHSAKPHQFMSLVERVTPEASRRLEMFCRTPRPGWTAWGNEIEPDLFSDTPVSHHREEEGCGWTLGLCTGCDECRLIAPREPDPSEARA